MIYENVIDVSYHQGKIDWQQVKASGKVDMAIIRIGFRGYGTGAICPDVRAKENLDDAAAVGIPVGAYFFSTALDDAEARAEAAYVIDTIKGYIIKGPVVFDYEGYTDNRYRTYGKTTQASRTSMCKAFCDAVKEAGYTSLIYGSKGVIRSKYDLSSLSDYGIWCARYAGGYNKILSSQEYFPDLGVYTSRITMWQYTSIGRVPGISGNVDMNFCYQDCHLTPGVMPDTEEDIKGEILKSIDNMEVYENMKTYKNGSTPEPVYADNEGKQKIGSLNPYETCKCLGIFDGMAAVIYTKDKSKAEKIGFVKYINGIQ
jgi:GH25 family lysozyme M1 (1,4-beta-N-acetylmuramidase)